MNKASAIVQRLHHLVGNFKNESGDEVIGKMLPEIASLLLTISEEMDAAQRQMARLTWAMLFLAVVTLVLGGIQLYVSIPNAKQTDSATAQPKVSATVSGTSPPSSRPK